MPEKIPGNLEINQKYIESEIRNVLMNELEYCSDLIYHPVLSTLAIQG